MYSTLIFLITFSSATVSNARPIRTSAVEDPVISDKSRGEECLLKMRSAGLPHAMCIGSELIPEQSPSQESGMSPTAMTSSSSRSSTPSLLALATSIPNDGDTWCENQATCTRLINSYTAQIKGNASIVDFSGVVTSFDIIWTQMFNGPFPQWQLTLYWDAGHSVIPVYFRATCKRSVAGSPDPTCGSRDFLIAPVYSTNRREDLPTFRTFYRNSQTLNGINNAKYHDDLNGVVTDGNTNISYDVTTIHTGRWNKCELNLCTYYQAPWTTTP